MCIRGWREEEKPIMQLAYELDQADQPYVSDFKDYTPETTREKAIRKFGGNPFIPAGLVATGVALGVGLWAFRSGRQRLSQQCQRARVGFQGLTVLAFLGGSLGE